MRADSFLNTISTAQANSLRRIFMIQQDQGLQKLAHLCKPVFDRLWHHIHFCEATGE